MITNIRYLRLLPGVAITVAVVVVIALLIWLKQILSEPVTPPRLKTQQITLITPPPPPPPPKQEEPPPEPEQKVETPQPDPEPQPDAPQDQPADDAPAGEELGLDADGGDGGDGFGLVGRKGGRSLIGGGGGGDAERWYSRRVQQGLLEFFNGYKELKKVRGYSVELRLWVDASGRVQRYQVERVSGGATRELISSVMADLDRVPPPPEGLQQPVHFRLISRG